MQHCSEFSEDSNEGIGRNPCFDFDDCDCVSVIQAIPGLPTPAFISANEFPRRVFTAFTAHGILDRAEQLIIAGWNSGQIMEPDAIV